MKFIYIFIYIINLYFIYIYRYVFIANWTDAANSYYGNRIGPLSQLHHGVSGEVYAVDSRTLFIKNFNYDGEGPGKLLLLLIIFIYIMYLYILTIITTLIYIIFE